MNDLWYFAGCDDDGHDPRFEQGPRTVATGWLDNALKVEVNRFYTFVDMDKDIRAASMLAHMCGNYIWDIWLSVGTFPTALCRLHPHGESIREGFTVLDLLSAPRTERLLLDLARHAALQVVDAWPAPPYVHEYLQTGNPSLRERTYQASREFISKEERKTDDDEYWNRWKVIMPASVAAAQVAFYSAHPVPGEGRYATAYDLLQVVLFHLGINVKTVTPYSEEFIDKLDRKARDLFAAAIEEQTNHDTRTTRQVGRKADPSPDHHRP